MNKALSDDARPLPVLRAMIDGLDHELIQLLARRTALVGEIARYKRSHGLPIRDRDREREILETRTADGGRLGLTTAIEGLFRVILWESRERQASLLAEVPVEMPRRKIAIVGGRGGMGTCMGRMLGDLGHEILVADLDTELTPARAAEIADVVIVSVPIAVTEAVIREVGPRVRPDGILMDVTSLKLAPMRAMLESSRCSVVGTHPMFGPTIHSPQGQRVVLCPGRGDEARAWVRTTLHARGMVIKEVDAQTHDRAMAVVQVLQHFATQVMGRTLASLGIDLAETVSFTSPAYLMQLWMTARHFAQSEELYASIAMENRWGARTCQAFVDVARQMHDMIAERDFDAFAGMFREVGEFFGPFTREALDQSSYLIDRLVERT